MMDFLLGCVRGPRKKYYFFLLFIQTLRSCAVARSLPARPMGQLSRAHQNSLAQWPTNAVINQAWRSLVMEAAPKGPPEKPGRPNSRGQIASDLSPGLSILLYCDSGQLLLDTHSNLFPEASRAPKRRKACQSDPTLASPGQRPGGRQECLKLATQPPRMTPEALWLSRPQAGLEGPNTTRKVAQGWPARGQQSPRTEKRMFPGKPQ